MGGNRFYIPPASEGMLGNFNRQAAGLMQEERAHALNSAKMNLMREDYALKSRVEDRQQRESMLDYGTPGGAPGLKQQTVDIGRQNANTARAQVPVHAQNFSEDDVNGIEEGLKQTGMDKIFKPLMDSMRTLGKNPNVTQGRAYQTLRTQWPAYQKLMSEHIEKELEKETDPARAVLLQDVLAEIQKDTKGQLVDMILPDVGRALQMEEMQVKAKLRPEGPKVLSPGSALVSPEGQILTRMPDKPQDTPSELREFELSRWGKEMPQMRGTPSYKDERLTYLKEMGAAKAAPNRAEPKILRQEFINQSKTFVEVRDSYNRIKASSKTPSPAGDLAMIFNYMKMLDPGSVVRESEFATAAQTGAYGERIKAAVQKVVSGERLSDAMRNDFKGRADMLYDEQGKSHEKLKSEYDRLAKESGVESSQVIIDYLTGEFTPGEVYQGQDGSFRKYAGKDPQGNHKWERVD